MMGLSTSQLARSASSIIDYRKLEARFGQGPCVTISYNQHRCSGRRKRLA
jgi:hypothetical protein